MLYGLLGKNLDHSFSRQYFEDKFCREGIPARYQNFPLASIADFPLLLKEQPSLAGLNVTVPYKEAIIPYLDGLSPEAEAIGAVNTIAFRAEGLIGHNSDWLGFMRHAESLLAIYMQRALILGSGGAAKAVAYALEQMGMTYWLVSRRPGPDSISYEQAAELLSDHFLLVNATPLGTWPHVSEKPDLEIEALSPKHLVYDLIYNPPESALLQAARERGAQTSNGREMLILQAQEAWRIWNEL